MTLTVSRMRGSSAARRPKRTSARASGLTTWTVGSRLSSGGRFLIGTKPSVRRGAVGDLGRSDPDVVAGDAGLGGYRVARDEGPALDLVVPGVGGLAQVTRVLVTHMEVEDVRRRKQCRDLDREREGREAAVLLPAVLPRHRPVAHDVAGRLLDHRQVGFERRAPQRPSRLSASASRIGKAHSSIWMPGQ